MIKIAVVDDEIIFRQYLRTAIDWASYGFEICFEERNGLDALVQVEVHKPDIILSDINMPFMDGLTFAKKVKEEYPEIVTVLITGYNEFEYAKKAIKLGVQDYILKPFEKKELLATLLDIKEKINLKRRDSHIRAEIVAFKKQNLFSLLIHNNNGLSDEDMKQKLKDYNFFNKTLLFQVAVVEMDDFLHRKNSKERNDIQNEIHKILNATMKLEGNYTAFYDDDGRIISIIEAGEQSINEDFQKYKYESFTREVQKVLNCTVTVGIGEYHRGLRGIWISYKESLSSLQNKFILGNNKVIEYNKVTNVSYKSGFYAGNVNENILISLRLNESKKIEKELEQVLIYIYNNNVSMDYTYAITMGLISVALAYVVEIGYGIEQVFGETFYPVEEIEKQETLSELWEFVKGTFNKVIEYSSGNKITKGKKLVKDAKEFIDINYYDFDLNIKKVAGSLYINSSYLRAQFKKELNITIGDYITMVRMQKAERLLKSGNIRFSEVSDNIGYKDASYFSKCFKKYFGVTPSEYEIRNK
ncbi:response regulator [Clostridium bowmanii]|uniref:response regulator n=1 Tax=Clostridium bowmanii TaxID=132925 RepID=UPI001C0C72D5|nr:response regulator [Clostridium bowmanii]MBU3188115.1 response regulator [Clostridium bowmanii]MCA1072296.1 response regulator [Clostridium bowmanii]